MNFKKILTASGLIGVITPIGLTATACGKSAATDTDKKIIAEVDGETDVKEGVAANSDEITLTSGINVSTTTTVAEAFSSKNIGAILKKETNIEKEFDANKFVILSDKIFQFGSTTPAKPTDTINLNPAVYFFQFEYDGVQNNEVNVPILFVPNYDKSLVTDINKLVDKKGDSVKKGMSINDYTTQFPSFIWSQLTPTEQSHFVKEQFKLQDNQIWVMQGGKNVALTTAMLNTPTTDPLNCQFNYSYGDVTGATINFTLTVTN